MFENINSVINSIGNVNSTIEGINKTNGVSPIGLIGRNGKREKPGFTPNESYLNSIKKVSTSPGNSNDTWFGVLLKNHPDYSSDTSKNSMKTEDRFDGSNDYPNFIDSNTDQYKYYSTRDHYLIFNDTSTDYFKHGLHIIDKKTPLRSEKNSRETWDGYEESPLRLSQFTTTPYENNDPILFGFELIIDSISSPLLNGSVEDFIDQFNKISEVSSRKIIIADFKHQFSKIFKTNASIQGIDNSESNITIPTSNVSNIDSRSKIFNPGKRAYLSYYLKKIQGLELLSESNTPSKKKYLTDYRNDVIKLVFTEDVSHSIGTLAYLYKLLYWSKPNGKYIIPDNLLRFNCDIIISEIRNLNRVRKAINGGNLEVIKDNVSRYVYSLKECQFYFDQPLNDSEIDLSQPPKEFDNYTVTMDYKYVTSKFERWIPNGNFGKYVGYNNGSIWKVGNSSRSSNGNTDISVPKFNTNGLNSLKQNGITTPIILENYKSGLSSNYEQDDNIQSSTLNNMKKTSEKASEILSKNLQKAISKEIKSQVNQRFRLLNNTLDKIRNASLIGRMREPTNIYKVPYYYEGISNFSNGKISSNFFFDIHNSLRDFAGDSIGSALGDNIGNIIKGGNNSLT